MYSGRVSIPVAQEQATYLQLLQALGSRGQWRRFRGATPWHRIPSGAQRTEATWHGTGAPTVLHYYKAS